MTRVSGRIGLAVAAVFLLSTVVLSTPTGAATFQPLAGVRSVASDGFGSCALLTSGKVNCWGYGREGQLGNETFYTASPYGSAVPVAAEGVGGSGILGGVASITGEGGEAGQASYCALLTSGKVDCWGYGVFGELGSGLSSSAVPVAVKGVGGTGTLAGVTSLTTGVLGHCALLTSGKVDCWGFGEYGQLGNGTFSSASGVPVAVKGVGGTGTLGGVGRLTTSGGGYCAVLTSGKVDCWGQGNEGQLGNGTFYTTSPHYGSDVPVAVKAVGGTGTLGGVASLTSSGDGYCALLTSKRVKCWGVGGGAVGNGTFSSSAVPVEVKGVGGDGNLGEVTSLITSGGYCALLTSKLVDCWGPGENGELGNGRFYTASPYGSDVPVAVKGVGGAGSLGGVARLIGSGSPCALLTSGKVDCWGYGADGELGNGSFYNSRPYGSAVPVAVKGVGGTGTLGGVASLTPGAAGSCAVLTSKSVDCWGYGYDGELGNGTFYTTSPYGSAVPVAVLN